MGRAPGGKVLDIGGATPAALGHGRGLVAHAEVVLSQGQTRPTAMA